MLLRFIVSSILVILAILNTQRVYSASEYSAYHHTPFTAKIAIIIDDLGYNKKNSIAALELPGAITYAIIPYSPYASLSAQTALKKQKEIILHAPMSNVRNVPLGKVALTEEMGEHAFNHTLTQAIESLPNITGVNNHMGSLLTQQTLPMAWTMKILQEKGLYFIDSRTTPRSVAWKTARKHNIPSLKRDVFIDNERNHHAIHKQFNQLIDIAKRQGYAVAIAHPYPETIDYLSQRLPTLKQDKVTLVKTSELVFADHTL